jgi:hypothetical protein
LWQASASAGLLQHCIWMKKADRDPVTAIRLAQQLKSKLDRRAEQQPDKPGRSEAIHRLVETGLEGNPASAVAVLQGATDGARPFFEHRGFSDRTIRALIDSAIAAPEHLLFMTEDQLRSIPGIGNVSLAEIVAYRDRFISSPGM